MPYDYNARSVQMVERAGFKLETKKPLPNSQKAKYELWYKLSRNDYLENVDKNCRGTY